MQKESIHEAPTVEEAKAAAAAELGVSEDVLTFEVLQQPQKKTLGLFGGCPARVRAVLTVNPAHSAAAYLREVLGCFGIADATVEVTEEDNGCVLKLSGSDIGAIIGRRGETLDALQYLAGLVANRVDNAYYRVTLDIGNYREKREQSLSGLARKLAGQAARTGRKNSLEPMNPYERRIIHTAVQEVQGATSWSVGSEPNRHVVIGPSDDNPVKAQPGGKGGSKPRRGGKNGGQGGSRPPRDARPPRENRSAAPAESRAADRPARPERPEREKRAPHDEVDRPEREVRQFVPRSNPLPMADGATPPSKTESEKEKTVSLYGRIDL